MQLIFRLLNNMKKVNSKEGLWNLQLSSIKLPNRLNSEELITNQQWKTQSSKHMTLT